MKFLLLVLAFSAIATSIPKEEYDYNDATSFAQESSYDGSSTEDTVVPEEVATLSPHTLAPPRALTT